MSYEIVTSVERCGEIVDRIQQGQHKAITLSAKGVNLGREGPMTLLNIGVNGGQSFLFDIKTNPALLKDGPLKSLLESDNITKIIKDCRWIYEALIEQFSVTLRDVFDTQDAHLLIEESNGNRLAWRAKLEDMVDLYGEDSTDLRLKGHLVRKWIGNRLYWDARPLTQEQIDYTVLETTVLFPIYTTLMRKLKESELYGKYNERVSETMIASVSFEVRTRCIERKSDLIKSIIEQIATKMDDNVISTLEDLNEEELVALEISKDHHISEQLKGVHPLRKERFIQVISEVDAKINQNPEQFKVTTHIVEKVFNYIHSYRRDIDFNFQAQTLLNTINSIQRKNILRFYQPDMPLEYFSRTELCFVRSLGIDDERDPLFVDLFDKVYLRDFKNLDLSYHSNADNFKTVKTVYRRVRFLATESRRCSPALKQLSQNIWVSFMQRYGADRRW